MLAFSARLAHKIDAVFFTSEKSNRMEQARIGRAEQLAVLAAFDRGEKVTFSSHQGAGFVAKYSPTVDRKQASPRRIKFDNETILLDAASRGDGDEGDQDQLT